ncbi:MAG: flagellar hook-basal body complex protein [Alphaproteobacteria bacterium]
MSLYGALFGAVSGLRSQGSKMGIISDNIANVNTVGYKQSGANFQTLVVGGSSSTAYQTGGVRSTTRMAVTKQGLLSATDSPTDIAISGNGMFVVRSLPNPQAGDQSAIPLFTRAGSFRQDSLGNFVNAAGYYLQGWPLDREGRLPGEPGNLNTTAFTNFDSLQTVNVESSSGIAQATTTMAIGANLDAGEEIFAGERGTARPDILAASNANINASAIIVGDEYGFAGQNNLHRGDSFRVLTGAGLQYDYTYGGFTVGRDTSVANGLVNFGDSRTTNTFLTGLASPAGIAIAAGSSYTINIPNHGMITGDQVTLAGFAGPLGATPAAQLNATHTITRVDANSFTITVITPHGGAVGTPVAPASITANTRQFTGNVLDASSPTQGFLTSLGASTFTPAALTFTITTPSGGARVFSFVSGSPNTTAGQFNSLNTLATAIDAATGLTARVVNSRLIVGSEDANESVTFTNGNVAGSATQRGIDWVLELGLANISGGSRRFNSLQSLATNVNLDTGVSATVLNPLSTSSLEIRVDDPLDTIRFLDLPTPPFLVPTVGTPIAVPVGTFAAGANIDIVITDATAPATLAVGDFVNISGLTNGIGGLPGTLPNGTNLQVVGRTAGTYTVRYTAPFPVTLTGGAFAAPATNVVSIVGESNQGSVVGALSLVPSLNFGAYTPQATAVLGPRYDASGVVGDNMASGDITAQFSRNVRIYDSLGTGHDIRLSFIKTAVNTWAAELHVLPASDINTSLVNGQVATGTITFNGDGSLLSVSTSLTGPIPINWTNGAAQSTIDLNLGTAGPIFGTPGAGIIGLTDGMSQFDSAYNVRFANQNGAPVGQLVSVSIDEEGFVIGSYSNGETQELYKLPIADFTNFDGLNPITGNVFSETRESGEANLREAGTNGTGMVVAGALEQSNVDLAEQLTDMIVAQRAYQANTRVISTTDQLLDALNQL